MQDILNYRRLMGKTIKKAIKQIKSITTVVNKLNRSGDEAVSEYEANKLDKAIDMLNRVANDISIDDKRETRYR